MRAVSGGQQHGTPGPRQHQAKCKPLHQQLSQTEAHSSRTGQSDFPFTQTHWHQWTLWVPRAKRPPAVATHWHHCPCSLAVTCPWTSSSPKFSGCPGEVESGVGGHSSAVLSQYQKGARGIRCVKIQSAIGILLADTHWQILVASTMRRRNTENTCWMCGGENFCLPKVPSVTSGGKKVQFLGYRVREVEICPR